jgi:hypothetical protein
MCYFLSDHSFQIFFAPIITLYDQENIYYYPSRWRTKTNVGLLMRDICIIIRVQNSFKSRLKKVCSSEFDLLYAGKR